ncbi:MAG: hypothetical protein HYR88_04730 [Verrucomicrobia bacterium]|nr:hypothetical protein [Verrucomicrobiota bacterium]MBI3867105.1 hypothetical protein [Verrucomicrobiota bacterium]
MKPYLLTLAISFAASCLIAADATPKDDVIAAAKKLGDKPNYSWKSNVEAAGNNRAGGGPTEGKTEKGGYSLITMTRGDNTIEAVIKDGKAAIKLQDGWQSTKEVSDAAGAAGGGRNPARMITRMVASFKAPAVQAADLAEKVKELKKGDESYSGDLSEEAAKELLSFGPRRDGADAPNITGAKGSAKFWVKDGVVSKYEFKVQGTVSFNGNDREVDRTTTVEVKDVGTTKVEVPEDAKKKIS